MTNFDKLTPEQRAALRAELIAWEMAESRIYGDPMGRAEAAQKVDGGLAKCGT